MSKKQAAIQNFENMPPEKQELFMEGVEFYKEEYHRGLKEVGSISVAAGFHELVTDSFNKDKEAKFSCSKGCSFCCYIHNEITNDEAELLVEYAEELNLKIDRERLEKQKGHNLENWMDIPHKDKACVFLGSEGECKVYDHRPSTCRKYYVASDPKLCDLENNTTEDVLVVVSGMAEMVYVGQMLGSKKVGLMADMLIEKLDEKSK